MNLSGWMPADGTVAASDLSRRALRPTLRCLVGAGLSPPALRSVAVVRETPGSPPPCGAYLPACAPPRRALPPHRPVRRRAAPPWTSRPDCGRCPPASAWPAPRAGKAAPPPAPDRWRHPPAETSPRRTAPPIRAPSRRCQWGPCARATRSASARHRRCAPPRTSCRSPSRG